MIAILDVLRQKNAFQMQRKSPLMKTNCMDKYFGTVGYELYIINKLVNFECSESYKHQSHETKSRINQNVIN